MREMLAGRPGLPGTAEAAAYAIGSTGRPAWLQRN